jgi:DNA invertase Pin-like site-specific DNA recombinase
MSSAFGPSPWFKKATMFGYARISTDKQSVEDKKQKDPKKKATIKRQMKEVNDALKAQGLPEIKPQNWFAEVASGTKEDRTAWRLAREAAMSNKGKTVIVVKDPSRWARNVDAAVAAWKPLKERGIPVYAVTTGIQTGTAEDIRPSENFFFLLNSGFAAQTSEVQQKKSLAGVARQEAEGALAGKGRSVVPFALRDPVLIFLENQAILSEPRGVPNLKRMMEAGSNPNGVSFSQAATWIRDEQERLAKLTPDEYQQWLDFRQRLRERLQRLGSDPWARGSDTGKLDYRANALYRMSGLYLKDPDQHEMPSEEFLDEVEKNFFQYLSDKDKKRRGKRGL